MFLDSFEISRYCRSGLKILPVLRFEILPVSGFELNILEELFKIVPKLFISKFSEVSKRFISEFNVVSEEGRDYQISLAH